ncbi:MAG: S8 family serine peptidase [Bacteroidales bacterium]|nr:S8 family serine peptidase [Bacteroidales bacterium]
MKHEFNYHYNIDFNPRNIVNDDPENANDSIYGNSDVVATDPSHGTFVSGIIAADRDNGIGMKGIADNVRIMAIRAVPDGDERDKDVANAIIYAVNNGASVINMSFGKDVSPQKHMVDKALKYAESKDVVLVHAAGNESQNTDKSPRYPMNFIGKDPINSKWLSIGASSIDANESLPGEFSNYGKKTVDIFAPGVNIYSLQPKNEYDIQDGTSYASPMVAGTAALLKSYYPSLSAQQIKEIILSSHNDVFKQLKVNVPSSGKKTKKGSFNKLSATGGLLNVYQAVKLAEETVKN